MTATRKRISSAPKTQPQLALESIDLRRELWLVKRLGEHGAAVTDGVTDESTRRQRVRGAIQHANLAVVICGRDADRRPITYAQAFEKIYGEKL